MAYPPFQADQLQLHLQPNKSTRMSRKNHRGISYLPPRYTSFYIDLFTSSCFTLTLQRYSVGLLPPLTPMEKLEYFTVSPGEFLKTQLKYLKDNLKKCLDRRSKATKSGAAASKLATCKYFDQLGFLCSKVSNKPTESNLTTNEAEDTLPAVTNSSTSVTQSLLIPRLQP